MILYKELNDQKKIEHKKYSWVPAQFFNCGADKN